MIANKSEQMFTNMTLCFFIHYTQFYRSRFILNSNLRHDKICTRRAGRAIHTVTASYCSSATVAHALVFPIVTLRVCYEFDKYTRRWCTHSVISHVLSNREQTFFEFHSTAYLPYGGFYFRVNCTSQ